MRNECTVTSKDHIKKAKVPERQKSQKDTSQMIEGRNGPYERKKRDEKKGMSQKGGRGRRVFTEVGRGKHKHAILKVSLFEEKGGS